VAEPPPAGNAAARTWELLALFLKLGVIGFGGPAAHVALMEDETVVRRGWLDRKHFVDALATTNLVPGPNSTEMAIHLGFIRAGVPGAIVAGLAFIMPAFVLMLGLSWAYFEYGAETETEALFYGLKPVVLAIIVGAVWRLARTSVTGAPHALLFAGAFVIVLLAPGFEVLVLLGAGLIGVALLPRLPGGRANVLVLPLIAVLAVTTRWDDTLIDVGLLFLRTGGLLFGGGYVMIPLIEHDVVERFEWLTKEQFLDGVALGQSTPGPIVITSTFVGYGAAGWSGAVVATVAVFAPSFVFAVIVARFTDRLRAWKLGRDFLAGVGAAVAGAILATAALLAGDALDDVLTWAIAIVALAVLTLTRTQAIYLLAAGAVIGFLAEGV
jgi:chromate transporter